MILAQEIGKLFLLTVTIREKVKRTVRRFHLLSRGDRMLVAVSGGPDSVALLQLLCDLKNELGVDLEVVHLQHGIRGKEAKDDARFVAELADQLRVPFHCREINLPEMKSEAGKGNLEALARAERYRFFADVARARKLSKVATGHTLDDQAETVLMWFLRGAGLKGMGGMAPLHQIATGANALTVIRPLLEVSKREILLYLKDKHLAFRVDRSNQDAALLRNWLRLDLLPKIQRRFDAHVQARLIQQAEICRDEDALMDGLARASHAEMLQAGSLNRSLLLEQPRALQRRILRLWVEQTRGHLRGLEFIHIEDMLRLIEQGPSQGRVSIAGGCELVREYDALRLEKRVRTRRPVCYDYPLEIGKILPIIEAGLEFYSERILVPPKAVPDDLMEAAFDSALMQRALSVRNFRRGDRFQPLGMTGHKKVKDLFIEKRVPLSIRARWPLVVAGEDIVWIPGYGRSATARVSKVTVALLHLKASPIRG